MLISVREAYKYARKHIEKDRLAPLSPVGVEDFGEHREKARVFYCRTVRQFDRIAAHSVADLG